MVNASLVMYGKQSEIHHSLGAVNYGLFSSFPLIYCFFNTFAILIIAF